MFRIRIHEQCKVSFTGEAYTSFGVEQCGEEVSAVVYITGTFRLLSNISLSQRAVSRKTGTSLFYLLFSQNHMKNLVI